MGHTCTRHNTNNPTTTTATITNNNNYDEENLNNTYINENINTQKNRTKNKLIDIIHNIDDTEEKININRRRIDVTSSSSYNQDDSSGTDLDKIIEALYKAIIKANNKVKRNSLIDLENYFIYNDETDIFEPRYIHLKINVDNDNEDIIKIPLLTLVKHSYLGIDKVKMGLKLDLDVNTLDRYKDIQTTEGNFTINAKSPLNTKESVANIEIEFKQAEPTEMLSKLINTHQPIL